MARRRVFRARKGWGGWLSRWLMISFDDEQVRTRRGSQGRVLPKTVIRLFSFGPMKIRRVERGDALMGDYHSGYKGRLFRGRRRQPAARRRVRR